jgi:hypothetical protein
MVVRASLYMRREGNQLDATEGFIVIICSTCFGLLYTLQQQSETILALLLHMVCNDAGGRLSGAGQQDVIPCFSLITDALPTALHLTADLQQPRHCTPYAVITQLKSRTPDDGHTNARKMSRRL